MENTMKMYVTADEAARILGVSRGYAYKIIRGLNNELKEKGYRVKNTGINKFFCFISTFATAPYCNAHRGIACPKFTL